MHREVMSKLRRLHIVPTPSPATRWFPFRVLHCRLYVISSTARNSYMQMHCEIHTLRNQLVIFTFQRSFYHDMTSTILMLYHRKLQNKLLVPPDMKIQGWHQIAKTMITCKSVYFHSITVTCKVKVISEWKKLNCIQNIFFCYEIIPILKF
jgi:hypothetical protein